MTKQGRGRPASGSIEWRKDHWRIRVRLADGSRQSYELDPGVSEEEARKLAKEMAELARKEGRIARPAQSTIEVRAKPDAESAREWSRRWLDYREERGLESVPDDRARLRDHVLDIIGDIAMAEVTEDHIRDVVYSLDTKVGKGELAWKTASNVWVLIRKMFKDACSAKRRDLRVRKDDPTENVEPPERGEEKARTYLYPSEFMQLVGCKKIPVEWRRLYAMAAYTLSRAGELAALRWDAVDLKRGVITFRQARRKSGGVKSTKTKKVRRIPIERSLLPLLLTLKEEACGSPIVIHVPVSKRAHSLRKHLRLAGLTRSELYPPPKDGSVARTWAPLTFHDLRGTGVTWMAQRGDEPLVIQQRAGHSNFSTTQRYLREAETLGRDGIDPFPPLPLDLFLPQFWPQEAKTSEISGAGHGARTRSATSNDATDARKPGDSSSDPASDDRWERLGAKSGAKIDAPADRVEARLRARLAKCQSDSVGVAEAAADVLREALGPARPDVLEGRLAAFAASMGGAS